MWLVELSWGGKRNYGFVYGLEEILMTTMALYAMTNSCELDIYVKYEADRWVNLVRV